MLNLLGMLTNDSTQENWKRKKLSPIALRLRVLVFKVVEVFKQIVKNSMSSREKKIHERFLERFELTSSQLRLNLS